MNKAKSQPVDALMFDLEDAIPISQKDDARALAARMVVPGAYGNKEAILRVNGFGTPWFDKDVDVAVESAAHAILVPKAEDPELLFQLGQRIGPDKDIWVMIESPLGVLNANAIAQVPNVKCLVAGTEDLKQFLRCAPQLAGRPQLQMALQTTVLAARAAGIAAIDGVYPLLDDLAGFELECQQGKDLGFDGKTLLHPSTVEAANRVFGPSQQEVEEARILLDKLKGKALTGIGAVEIDGRLVEDMHVERARQTLQTQEAIEAAASLA